MKIPQDTIELYVEMNEKDIHLLSSIIKGYDGIAHVRRDWVERGDLRLVKILVPPGFEEEVKRALEHAKNYMPVGKIQIGL
ncbi:DUF4911 domain-containing protein [Candidatus Acetothermia bacterium]|nr:DUF4911 domain-containing protein [Candidatus Acetothermia bacterium]MBI3643554.1 DUF4911 domain-containing protein [Candidatus Acetothermia bacterium]